MTDESEPTRDRDGYPFWPIPSFGKYAGVTILPDQSITLNGVDNRIRSTAQALAVSNALRYAALYVLES